MDTKEWETIAELMARKAAGCISDQEQAHLDRWLEKSAANREAYDRFICGQSMRTFYAANPAHTLKTKRMRQQRTGLRRRMAIWIPVAAAVVIAAVMVTFRTADHGGNVIIPPTEETGRYQAVLSLSDGRQVTLGSRDQGRQWQKYAVPQATGIQEQQGAEQNIRISIPFGSEYKLELDDGTLVWLNAGSAIEYPSGFSSTSRDVALSGEAYFEVARDTLRPFRIATQDDLRIAVLGTKFNVRSYNDMPQAHVTLLEGSVEVSCATGQVRLDPNQQALFDRAAGELSSREVDDASAYMAWTEGRFDFESAPLHTILETMAQWYGMKLEYEDFDDASAGDFTIKVARHGDFTQILDIVGYVAGIGYRLDGDTVTITGK